VAAEHVTAAIAATPEARETVSDSLPPSYRHQPGG